MATHAPSIIVATAKVAIARLTALALIAMALTSCSMHTAVAPPSVDLPDRFSASGEKAFAGQWWTAFDDPELNAWVDLGLQANQTLSATMARLRQSEATRKRARSGFFPSLDLTLERQRRWINIFDTHHIDQWSVGLSTTYEIDFWGRISALDDKALFDVAADRSAVQTQANTVAANIATSWFNWISQQEKATLLNNQQKRIAEALTVIEGRFQRGRISITDVWRQEQLLKALISEQIQTKAQIAVNRNQLALWAGQMPHTLPRAPARDLPDLPAVPDTGIPLEGLKLRPDIRAAWARVESANAGVAAAIAERYPRLTLTGSYSSESEDISDLFDNWFANLAANALLPLIDGGKRRAQVKIEQAALEGALANYRQALIVAVKEVEDALVQERQQFELLDTLRERLELARKTEKRQRQRYLKGVNDFLDLLEAQQNTLVLEQNWLSARNQLLQFRIQLYRALSHGDFGPTPINEADHV